MSEIDKIERKFNNRLKANGFQPVRPDSNSWWDEFCINFVRRHARDQDLLAKGPRPMYEEWTDLDGAVWIADGSGVFHYLHLPETLNQEAASGFGLHEIERSHPPDMRTAIERGLLAGLQPNEIDARLKKLGGPFGPVSWIAKARFMKEVLELEQQTGWEKKAAKQNKGGKTRSTKAGGLQLRDACPSEGTPTDA